MYNLFDMFAPAGGAVGIGGGLWTVFRSKKNEESLDKLEEKVDNMVSKHSKMAVHIAENYTPNAQFQRLEGKIDALILAISNGK